MAYSYILLARHFRVSASFQVLSYRLSAVRSRLNELLRFLISGIRRFARRAGHKDTLCGCAQHLLQEFRVPLIGRTPSGSR
jgi:hypothetical protein